jgi:hypothetical protein
MKCICIGFSICRKVIKLSKQQIKKLLLNLQYGEKDIRAVSKDLLREFL